MKVVLANGCFDPLHFGHILHLRAARALGDRLVVALTSDEMLRLEKGDSRPLYPWVDRAEILRELRCVSEVMRSDDAAAAVRRVAPNIFVKGIDYASGGISEAVRKACQEVGAKIAYTTTPKLSASAIVRRMRDAA